MRDGVLAQAEQLYPEGASLEQAAQALERNLAERAPLLQKLDGLEFQHVALVLPGDEQIQRRAAAESFCTPSQLKLPQHTHYIAHQSRRHNEQDYFAIGQCTPGIIAVNTATFIGHKYKGLAQGDRADLGAVRQAGALELLGEEPAVEAFQPLEQRLPAVLPVKGALGLLRRGPVHPRHHRREHRHLCGPRSGGHRRGGGPPTENSPTRQNSRNS